MDQLREECGVFGVYNQSEMDSAHMGYFALQAYSIAARTAVAWQPPTAALHS